MVVVVTLLVNYFLARHVKVKSNLYFVVRPWPFVTDSTTTKKCLKNLQILSEQKKSQSYACIQLRLQYSMKATAGYV